MFEEMAETFYSMHYREAISLHLTRKQKEDVAQRISSLTLERPIWTDRETNFADSFPELSPYVNTVLSGLYLVAILKSIVNELQN